MAADRFCCNDEESWLAGSRKCDGIPECPSNEGMGEPGGEDEEYCGEATDRKNWCDDTDKYPDVTELEINGQSSIPLWGVILAVIGVLLIAALVAWLVFKTCAKKWNSVPTQDVELKKDDRAEVIELEDTKT